MASIQRVLLSVLVILTFTFVYFAQTAEAAGKGPKITHKVYFDIRQDCPQGMVTDQCIC
jgi:peptidyl-prolyl cis-trans isomerase B (cyclophilin B)